MQSFKVDMVSRTITHTSGLTISVAVDTGQPRPNIGGACWDASGRQWLLTAIEAPVSINSKDLPRLMRIAGEAWVKEISKQ